MSEQAMNRNLMELGAGVEVCMENRLQLPTLTLLFSAIDVAAWLANDDPMRLGSRGRFGPELLDDRLTWQNRAVGQLLGIAASDQRMPTGHTQVQIFHADSLRSSFLTIRGPLC